MKPELDTNDEIQQFLNPNTSSLESLESDNKSIPSTPLCEPEAEVQIRKEKNLPRAVGRRAERHITRKLEESMNGHNIEEQPYTNSYALT